MKRLFVIILIYLAYSCDPTYCYDYIVENKTNENVEIIKFSTYNGEVKSVKTEILANSSHSEYKDCSLGRGGSFHYTKDSIQIKSNQILLKTYYPDDKLKSIFRTDDDDSWKTVESKNNYEKYVFEITEEDLK